MIMVFQFGVQCLVLAYLARVFSLRFIALDESRFKFSRLRLAFGFRSRVFQHGG